MKKLQAILTQAKSLKDRLFSIREKQIKSAIQRGIEDLEETQANAESNYEEVLIKLGAEERPNYVAIFNKALEYKATIQQAKESIALMKEIQKDLDSVVEE